MIQMLRAALHKLRTPKASPQSLDSLVVSRRVKASAHDSGLALLAIDSGVVFTCNRSGAFIWQSLEMRRTPASIAAEISDRYELAQESAEHYVASFIRALSRYGLITAEGGR